MPQPVAERRLGTWPIFVIAVSAMTPLTVVAGALPLGYGQVEEKGIPVAYMLVAAVLGVFAVGLAAMARHVPNRGAFYAYAAAGLSRPAGVGTAFVALLAYNAMQIGLYGAFGVAAHNAMAILGVEISWVVWALVGWALIALLGRLNIDLNARILTVLVCAEVLIVLILDAAMVTHPAGGTISFETLNPGLIASAGGVALLVAAVAGMVGFEAPLVYAAEARDPRRTVSRAIALTLLVAAVLYGGTAWVMSVVAGPDQIVAIAGDHLDDLFFFLPEPYLPAVVIDLARVFFATSLFAAMLAFHHTVARYALTVAREGVLPSSLARTRDDVPVTASVAQSGLALGVLLVFALAGWNPTTDLFFFGTVSGGLGVLILMVIASIAVVRYFRRGDHGETRWRRAVAPWIATVFLVIILLLTVASFGILLDSDNLAKVWSPPLAFLLLYLAGVRWGRKLRREHPEVYAVIGTGQPPEEVPSRPDAAAGAPDPAAGGAGADAGGAGGAAGATGADAGGPGSDAGVSPREGRAVGEGERSGAGSVAARPAEKTSPPADEPIPGTGRDAGWDVGRDTDREAGHDTDREAGHDTDREAGHDAAPASGSARAAADGVIGAVGAASDQSPPAARRRASAPQRPVPPVEAPVPPVDAGDTSRVIAEAGEASTENGTSGTPARSAPQRRVPRARRSPDPVEGGGRSASGNAGGGDRSASGSAGGGGRSASGSAGGGVSGDRQEEGGASAAEPAPAGEAGQTGAKPADPAGPATPGQGRTRMPRQRSPRGRRPENPNPADVDRPDDSGEQGRPPG
ncbi:amino acid permease [Actinoplanes sp. DH11]|uniref:amino acid permease n=1 Tax=Actinoplanes sp. DH11 TaxID=2857011 RepID=UPI001E474F63|nr:amino acid permease [Actinoplanes sp. DH11]